MFALKFAVQFEVRPGQQQGNLCLKNLAHVSFKMTEIVIV